LFESKELPTTVPHLFDAFTCRLEFPATMNDEIMPVGVSQEPVRLGAGAIGTSDLAFIIDGHCTRASSSWH